MIKILLESQDHLAYQDQTIAKLKSDVDETKRIMKEVKKDQEAMDEKTREMDARIDSLESCKQENRQEDLTQATRVVQEIAIGTHISHTVEEEVGAPQERGMYAVASYWTLCRSIRMYGPVDCRTAEKYCCHVQ